MTTIIGFKTNNDTIVIGGDKILTSDRKFPECVNITKIFDLDDDVTIAACGNPMIYEFARNFVQNKTIFSLQNKISPSRPVYWSESGSCKISLKDWKNK